MTNKDGASLLTLPNPQFQPNEHTFMLKTHAELELNIMPITAL